MEIKWSSNFTPEAREQTERFAAAKGYLCRWGDPIKQGEQYMRTGGREALTAQRVCDYTAVVVPTDIWEVSGQPSFLVKIIPRPSRDTPSLDEKLDLILQKLEAVEYRLKGLVEK